jgi:hypothetical protein
MDKGIGHIKAIGSITHCAHAETTEEVWLGTASMLDAPHSCK